MTKQIILTAESTCDLGAELIAQCGIRVIPMHVVLGERDYLDGVTMTAEEMLRIYETQHIVPKSAAINIAEFHDFFAPLVADGSEVVHVSLSSALSSTCNNAVIAAAELPGVHVVDGKNLSSALGLLLLKAHEYREAGDSAADIARKLTELVPRVRASFVIDSLELLYKGGRCSAVARVGAGLLKIKPCIEVDAVQGTMGVGKKYRGTFAKVLMDYCADKLSGVAYDSSQLFITHAGVEPSIVEAVKAKVAELAHFDRVTVTRAGMTISTHCGRNTLGVLFISKT